MNTFYTRPSITRAEYRLVKRAFRDSWGTSSGKWIRKFEDTLSQVLGSEFAVATSSCTGALHLGLAALGIGRGDEVILADSNWIATAAPINHTGAVPVLVDIARETWCIDPAAIVEKISNKTKAIIATHLYGQVADIESLQKICKEHNLFLIEDAAEGLGSTYRNQHVGTFGDLGVFSFHGSKTLTTGEGGAIVTNNEELAMTIRILSRHGRVPSEPRVFWPSRFGFKYSMSDVQAAIGIAQLRRFSELVYRKQEILELYRQAFKQRDRVVINPPQQGVVSGAWMPNLFYDRQEYTPRELFQSSLLDQGIDARPFFWPLSSTGLFRDKLPESSNANYIASRSINLPSYHDISKKQIKRVIEVIDSTLDSLEETTRAES